MYVRLEVLGRRLREARTRSDELLPPWKYPLALYNHSFQDGFADALAHTRAMRKSGSDRRHGDMLERARNYLVLATEARRKRNYWDAAYATGYEAGLFTTVVDKVPLNKVPVYYCPGLDAVSSFKKVSEAIRGGPDTHKAAYKWAEKIDRPVDFYSVHLPFI
jgi:hypothetical protein